MGGGDATGLKPSSRMSRLALSGASAARYPRENRPAATAAATSITTP